MITLRVEVQTAGCFLVITFYVSLKVALKFVELDPDPWSDEGWKEVRLAYGICEISQNYRTLNWPNSVHWSLIFVCFWLCLVVALMFNYNGCTLSLRLELGSQKLEPSHCLKLRFFLLVSQKGGRRAASPGVRFHAAGGRGLPECHQVLWWQNPPVQG